MKNYSKIWISFLIGLGGCADNDFSDLDAFFEGSYSLPGLTIEPVPQTMPYQAFAYRAARVRSPFSLPPDPNGISKESPVLSEPPDMKRQREFLETFSLESLTMVGSLNRAGKT